MLEKLKLKIKEWFLKKFRNNDVIKKMYKFQHITHLKDFIFNIKKYGLLYKENNGMILYGSPKLHGTNASIVFYKDGTYQIQSRNNILNEHKDNMDFYKWMNKERINFIKEKLSNYLEKYPMVVIYGEYAGKSIQQGVAISKMERFFAPFAIRLINRKEDYYIVPENMKIWNEGLRIFDLFKPKHIIQLDSKKFNDMSFVEEIDNFVKKYETQDVFSEQFNINGTGEGIVWHYIIDGKAYFFKTKIDEFQTKAQKVNYDKSIEQIKEEKKIVEYCLNEHRLKQGIDYLKENNFDIRIENIKSFIGFIVKDVLREEQRFLEDNAISEKTINKLIGTEAARWYKQHLNKEGL
jgi:hypothetical protein